MIHLYICLEMLFKKHTKVDFCNPFHLLDNHNSKALQFYFSLFSLLFSFLYQTEILSMSSNVQVLLPLGFGTL